MEEDDDSIKMNLSKKRTDGTQLSKRRLKKELREKNYQSYIKQMEKWQESYLTGQSLSDSFKHLSLVK
jgi:hypothetical protein